MTSDRLARAAGQAERIARDFRAQADRALAAHGCTPPRVTYLPRDLYDVAAELEELAADLRAEGGQAPCL